MVFVMWEIALFLLPKVCEACALHLTSAPLSSLLKNVLHEILVTYTF